MDAWEILSGNSTLTNGDAWDHLNNQAGEYGGVITVVQATESFVAELSQVEIIADIASVSAVGEISSVAGEAEISSIEAGGEINSVNAN